MKQKRIALLLWLGKGGTQWIHALKTVCTNLVGFGKEFYSSGSCEVADKTRLCAGQALLSSGLRRSLEELVSGGLP